ncbi:MAG: AarF/ABC1/UbiB kinase family protein, partial [Actinobacteria bacterium]|nr:AarF/ABC1/UbiB kinase family protein [Actinomycetota bacterium]
STLRRSGVLDALRSWDRQPIASASVAQVHAAVLNDGTEVVIKVRRPGIVGLVASDAAYLLPALQFAESRDERLRVANLSGTVELMLRLFAQECDLVLEATSAVQLALAFEKAGVNVHVPAPIPGLVTKRVMVMERVHGVSAADVDGSAQYGHVAADLVRLAIAGVLETTLVDGIFHGDLHPGNVLITESGMSLVDFGIVGRMSEHQRLALLQLLPAAFNEDRTGIVRALAAFGALPDGADPDAFLDQLPTPPTEEERLRMMEDRAFLEERIRMLLRAVSGAGFRAPPQLTLFLKNVLYLGDAVARHAPDMDVIAETSAAVLRVAARLGAA